MKKKYYLTTTLPYVNADPHIGFALEITQADVLARFHRLSGKEIFFNTGTDENGLKIYRKANKEKKDPQDYVDIYAAKFNQLKTALNLSYNNFIRTTDKHHQEAAQEFWRRCQKNGDIYKAKQKIKYCVGCELEKTDSELVDNKCPIHPNKKIEILKEENYFFRFSKYQQPLLNLYQKNTQLVVPQTKLKEIKNFVAGGLKDFSISRLKKKLPWGVTVPNDPEHVMYVWFDALINYISALGWPKNSKKFNDFWPGIQIAGKDNLRQQSAMWQAMLMSAGLPTTKQILIHGFITANGQKMSKSLGNVINPFGVVNKYGTDATRYYLLREIPPFKDGDFSYARFEQLYNADLANGLGNLVARTAKLCEKDNVVIEKDKPGDFKFQNLVIKALNKYRFNDALASIWKIYVDGGNHYIDKKRPWELSGNKLKTVLIQMVLNIKMLAYNLQPFIPETAAKVIKQFRGPKIKFEKSLFPRIR